MPSKKVYEDAEILGFQDIRPLAPVHFMLVPKKHIASLARRNGGRFGCAWAHHDASGRLAREQGSRPRAIVSSSTPDASGIRM